MFSVTSNTVAAFASTTGQTVAGLYLLIGGMLAVPVTFYILRRIQGMFPKK